MKLSKLVRKLRGLLMGGNPAPFAPVESTEEERHILGRCEPFTMTSKERLWATMTATKYILKNRIPGALVECGVWRGGSSMAMLEVVRSEGASDRELFLFDTFAGMTQPTDIDRNLSGEPAQDQLDQASRQEGGNIWCIADISDVRNNLHSTGYPSERMYFIKGDVADTLRVETNLPTEIALLRLDTDWYESTKAELEILFPRLVRGGVCLIDDYGHWQGARKAVDDYLEEQQIFPLIHVTDYTGRAFIKP
jgi:predicted O-methyltransferase YrrM